MLKKTLPINSETQLVKPESPEISENLSKNVAMQLLKLMSEITKDEINTKTVSSACLCASEITKILKLNLEIKKMERQYE